ncbi:MAG: indolepyruvate oxidoreductase subunit beta [Alkalispirochaeta sp.]
MNHNGQVDIILAGVGGQGILSIAAILGHAALSQGLRLKQAEVHGMSQRGGDVQSHLRISDTEIHSDLVPFGGADIVLSVEPLESLRYLPYLKPDGWVVTSITPVRNIPDYPELDAVLREIDALPHSLAVDAEAIAREVKNRLGMNMVMTGAASPFLPLPFDALTRGIAGVFGRKGDEVVAANVAALEAGRRFSLDRLAAAGVVVSGGGSAVSGGGSAVSGAGSSGAAAGDTPR